MNNQHMNPMERTYAAFISYRHLPLDRAAAMSIQKKIENFVVPKEFRDRTGGAKKLGACFRDEDELPASSSLSQSIMYALDRSRYLIVICTPNLPLSRWCMAEISYFLQTHDRDHILAVLADGDPNESFPDQLRFVHDGCGNILAEVEPLAANVSSPDHKLNTKALKKESMRLCAAMLGCPFDALWQREHRAKTNRLLAAGGVVLAAMAVFIGVVLSKNAQISKQNLELEKKMSSALVDAGQAQLKDHDPRGAMQNALDALESDDPEIYDHRAEKLLADALGAYYYQTPECMLMMRQTTNIERIATSADGSYLFTADKVGNIYGQNFADSSVFWETFLNTSGAPWLYPIENDRLLCKAPDSLTALSMRDGSILWSYKYSLPNSFQVLSDDGALFAILDWDMTALEELAQKHNPSLPSGTVNMKLLILDTQTGQELRSYQLPDDPYHIYINSYDPIYDYAGDFSDDNSCLAFALPTKQDTDEAQTLLVFLTDSAGDGFTCINTYDSHPDVLMGMEVSKNKESVYWAFVDSNCLYSVISYADTSADPTVNTAEYHMASSTGLSYDYMNTDRPFLPMLSSDDLIVLCSQNTLFVIDRSSGALRYTLNLESPIVSAIWMYKSMGILEILCQNGRRTMYSLFYNSGTISDYDTDMLPVSDLKLGYLRFNVQDGPYAAYTLAVSADQPNHLLGVVETSDPEFQGTSMHNYSNCAFARLTPSGNRLMLFYPTESQGSSLIAEKVIVKTVDVQTGELCEEVTLSLSPNILPVRGLYDPPVPTDDSHFLLNGSIYGLDGSVSALNEGSEQNDLRSAILQDGRLLYAWSGASATLSQPAEGKKYVSFSCKIDGEDTGNGSSVNEKISLEIDKDDSASHFSVGRNGWMAGWGRPISTEETGLAALTGKIIVSEQMAIIAQNALNGEKVEIPYSQEDRPLAHLVLSNREAYLAFAFENGVAGFYDLQNKVSAQIPKDYATGEIREICFSDNDNYLLIMTVNGRIDCFTLAPVALAAELNECFAVSSEDLIDWVSVTEDTEDHHLILTAANESGKTDPTDLFRAKYWTSVLDTDSWEFTAQPENICGWSVEHGKALLVNGAGVGTVKTRTLKDLVEWARSELEQ